MGTEAGWIVYYVVMVIIVAAGSYASYKAAQDAGGENPSNEEGLRVNTRSTTEPLKVIYGKGRVGGNDVYYKQIGVNNKVLWVVQTLCEGPIDSIMIGADEYEEVYLGNEKAYNYSAAHLSY